MKVSLLWEDTIAAICFLAMMYGAPHFLFSLERADLTPAARVALPPSPEVAQPVFSFPIPYDVVIVQSGDGIDKPVARYYVRTSAK